jgi:DNA end-binding protein Ku
MPRSIWSGSISFGLVNVPVKLTTAVSPKDVRFNQLHATDHSRIQQKRFCAQEGIEVPYEEIVKGYEISPGQYVVMEPEELAALDPKATHTIEIEEFVDLDQIDPIYYDHPYYLAPGTGGAKPYRLLLEAMEETGKVAIARVVIRSKEQLVAVRPMGIALGMATMLFPDEVLPPERLDEVAEAANAKITKREVDIAKQLIESLAGDFEPDKFRDTYRDEVLALIERKAEGKEIAVQPPAEEVRAPTPDLMSALKASLDAVRAAGDGNGAAKPKPKRPAARKAAAKKAPAKAGRSRAPAK